MDRVTRAPAADNVRTEVETAKRNTLSLNHGGGQTWHCDKILGHHLKTDESLSLEIKWSVNWTQTWEPQEKTLEETVSRYLLVYKDAATRPN